MHCSLLSQNWSAIKYCQSSSHKSRKKIFKGKLRLEGTYARAVRANPIWQKVYFLKVLASFLLVLKILQDFHKNFNSCRILGCNGIFALILWFLTRVLKEGDRSFDLKKTNVLIEQKTSKPQETLELELNNIWLLLVQKNSELERRGSLQTPEPISLLAVTNFEVLKFVFIIASGKENFLVSTLD